MYLYPRMINSDAQIVKQRTTNRTMTVTDSGSVGHTYLFNCGQYQHERLWIDADYISVPEENCIDRFTLVLYWAILPHIISDLCSHLKLIKYVLIVMHQSCERTNIARKLIYYNIECST